MKSHSFSLQEAPQQQRCIKEKLKFREMQRVSATVSFLSEAKEILAEILLLETRDLVRPIVIVGQRIRLIAMSSTPT